MLRENIERAKDVTEALDELDELIGAFEPGTAWNGTDKLAYVYLNVCGRGNTTGNATQQKFNGLVSLRKLQSMEEYKKNA